MADEVEERKKKLEEEAKKEQEKLDKEQIDKAKKEHPDDKIARAEAAAERIEEANKVAAAQLEELRTFKVNEALSGQSEAGSTPPKPTEETPKEYADKVMEGKI